MCSGVLYVLYSVIFSVDFLDIANVNSSNLPFGRLFVYLFRQRRYFACHIPMLGGEPGHRQEGDTFCPPGGCHHKHGRNGTLRGRGSHLHRSDEWNCT